MGIKRRALTVEQEAALWTRLEEWADVVVWVAWIVFLCMVVRAVW